MGGLDVDLFRTREWIEDGLPGNAIHLNPAFANPGLQSRPAVFRKPFMQKGVQTFAAIRSLGFQQHLVRIMSSGIRRR